MKRPKHLPDYADPPLDEVVLGVQFSPVANFSSIHARTVWELFKEEFPKIEEHSILDAQFETFGGTGQRSGPEVFVGRPPIGTRLWFLSEDGNHLLQFQPDRFILNWRRRPNVQPYPHFEGLAESYATNIEKLEAFFASNFSYSIDVNQAEVSYINIIPVDQFSQIGEWFRFWSGSSLDFEGISANFSEVIKNSEGKPFARLHHNLQSVFTADGKQRAFRLSLSFKGKPFGNDTDAALEFLKIGREAIVMRFEKLTTERAQQAWGRKK